MKYTRFFTLLISSQLLLSGCGNQSQRGTGSGGLRNFSGSSSGSAANFFIGSGNTGSQSSGATSGASVNNGAQGGAPAANLNSNPFARNSITSASDPQQCANIFNGYSRFEGNFERALSDLTTCLNQVMLTQNPTLNQQYQTLQQSYTGYPTYGYGWGSSAITR